MRRTIGTVVVMLVALFAVPVLGREFGSWRADGTARWGPGGFTPLVADLGGAPETTPDHMVIVPRNVLPDPTLPGALGELAAYFPGTASGLGPVVAGAGRINPSFERFLDTSPAHANAADL